MTTDRSASPDPLLVRAMRGESVERTPVWAMRQAGRWDPEFRALRAGRTFYEFSENAELSAAASLCPRRFGVDAIILFYDITTLSVAMGQEFDLVPKRGPVPRQPIRTMADVERLADAPDPSSYEHVLETLRIVRGEVGRELAVLVFAGAPFTMAAYQTGIGKNVAQLATFARENRRVWEILLERTARATVGFVNTLLGQGADAFQIFDSWAGRLSSDDYQEYAHAFHRRIFAETAGPGILFVKDLPYIETAVTSGCAGINLGTGHDLAHWVKQHPDMVWQGNVDHELLVHGNESQVREATRRCLEQGRGGRHILNLDHGMVPAAKPENFRVFVETATAATT